MNFKGSLALALSFALAGCETPEESEHAAGATSPILDGQASGRRDDGIVLIRTVLPDSLGQVVCSASLIAANLLLTARHCVSYFQEGSFACTAGGELITSDGGGRLGLHFSASSIEVYAGRAPRAEPVAHGQQVISTLSETICVNDVAFVVLDTPLDLPVIPLRLGRPAEVGELVVLAGFGLTSDDDELDFRTQARRRKSGLSISGVGPNSVADGVTKVPPRTITMDGPSGCVGDSGGPLLDEGSGALLGVYSLQLGSRCADPQVRHFLTHVPPFRLLVERAFEAAGAEPLLEPEPSAAGAAGAPGTAGAEAAPARGGAGGADGVEGVDGEASSEGGAGGASDNASAESQPGGGSSGCSLSSLPPERGAVSPGLLLLAALAAAVQRVRDVRGRRRLGRSRCYGSTRRERFGGGRC